MCQLPVFRPVPCLFLLLLFVLILSCREEEAWQLPEKGEASLIRDPFDSLIQNKLTIDWSHFISGKPPVPKAARTDSAQEELVEFDTNMQGYWSLDDSTGSHPVSFKLIAEKAGDALSDFTLLKFVPASDSVDVSAISYLNMQDFSGTVYKYNEAGALEAIEGFLQGELQATLTDFSQKPDSAARLAYVPPNDGEDGGYFVTIKVSSYTDWYVSVNGGPYYYAGSDYNGSHYETIWVPASQYTGNNGGGEAHEHHSGGSGISSAGHASPHPNDIPTNNSFPIDYSKITQSNKPLYEYTNKCTGIQQAWNLSSNQNKEVAGFVTSGGEVIITSIGTYSNSNLTGIYEYSGKTYYQYPVSAGGPPAINYPGMFVRANRYFIPIVATFHTHNPCLQDGTDGVSGSAISSYDKNLAAKYPNTKHYVIGCGAIAQYNNSGSFNVQRGSLSSLCNNIK